MKTTEVLIIGAGPSGMISALCLAKLGIPCILVERNVGLNKHPKAHELNSRSIEILLELGFTEEELSREASPTSDGARILFCNTINEELGRIDLEEGPGLKEKYERHLRSKRPYLNISQTALEGIMLAKVEAHPLIQIWFNHQWESQVETANGVNSKILNRASEETFTVNSPFVIAADGAGSRCRKFVGIQMDGCENMQEFASAYFEANLRDFIHTPAKLYWILNPFAPGTFIAHHIEKRWVYMLPMYEAYQKREQFTPAFFAQTIKTALGNPNLDIDVKSISFWRMSAQLAEQYRKGRTILVGDAAHCFPPTGGLGMNTGIADAHNIAWKLTAVLRGTAPIEFLDTYQTERRPIAAQNSEESVHNFQKIMEVPEAFGLARDGVEKMAKFRGTAPTKWLPKSIQDAVIGLAQNQAARKLERMDFSPTLQQHVQETINEQLPHFDRIGLDIGYIYEDGALVADGTTPPVPSDRVTEYVPTTHPGARFPHLDLSVSGDYHSTHDFLAYDQFTLIIREEGKAWEAAYLRFIAESDIPLKLIHLDQLDLPRNLSQELRALCEIEATGALLIRPDGHVAFRSNTRPAHSQLLFKLFNQIFQNQHQHQLTEEL
ncbi:MAG: FAD-dependent monooxygenase [Bacteroidota bacterium]